MVRTSGGRRKNGKEVMVMVGWQLSSVEMSESRRRGSDGGGEMKLRGCVSVVKWKRHKESYHETLQFLKYRCLL